MTGRSARLTAAVEFGRRHWPQLLATLLLTYILFGNAGFRSLVGNWMELRRLHGDIARLRREEVDLDAKLRALRAGDSGVEGAARRDLGYIKKGEIEYRFPPPDKSP